MAACFTANLLTHIDVGHVMLISGKIKNEAEKFEIHFSNNNENNKMLIPLKILANRRDNKITLCADVNDGELLVEVYNVETICENSSFKFYVLALDDKFRIALNEEHLCSFNYRCAVSVIKMIKIHGDVDVKQVDHRMIYPYSWPQNHQDLSTIAFSADVPCRFSPNTIIILRMMLSGDDMNGSFFIRFNEKGTQKQLFHFNPRFEDKQIVCNCMNDKLEWQTEMRSDNFPFVINQEFQIGILMDSSYFQVAVNGHHILKFPFKSAQSTKLRNTKNHSIFERLTGLKMFALKGLHLQVTYVDFFTIKENDSKFYEIFSSLNFT